MQLYLTQFINNNRIVNKSSFFFLTELIIFLHEIKQQKKNLYDLRTYITINQ